ncbi:MAG: arylsulfatase [Puniceicoccaceae bacterium]
MNSYPSVLSVRRLLILALLFSSMAVMSARSGPPNIIYIMADDLGYGDLGCYGQKVLKTPRLDRMADQGIRLTSHYAGNSVCRPSRYCVWSGMDPRHAKVIGNQRYVMQDSDTTVAELLKKAGYTTGGVGKWAMASKDEGHPNDHGFDFWMGFLDQSAAHNHFPDHLWRNRERVTLPGNVVGPQEEPFRGRVSVKKVTYAHDVMTDEALDFIRREADGPFLLHVHWTIPHANNEAGRALGDGMEVPDYGPFLDLPWPNTEKGFAEMIRRMDQDVGRIIDLLKELGIDKNTLVIFTSDNGPHHEGGHDHAFFDSNGPLRGYKRDLYDGGIRVPFIARWPGTIPAGSTSDFPSAFWDFLPTACEVAGIDPPDGIDGLSYLPVLQGLAEPEREALYWRFDMNQTVKQAVRSGNWKLVQPATDAPWELYDVDTDPGETTDLAKKHPAIVQKLISGFED